MMRNDRDVPGNLPENPEALALVDLRKLHLLFEDVDPEKCRYRYAPLSPEVKQLLVKEILETPLYDLDKIIAEGVRSAFMLSPYGEWVNVWRLHPDAKRKVPVLDWSFQGIGEPFRYSSDEKVLFVRLGGSIVTASLTAKAEKEKSSKGIPIASLSEIEGFLRNQDPIIIENWQKEYVKGKLVYLKMAEFTANVPLGDLLRKLK